MTAFMPALALHKATPRPKMNPKPSLVQLFEVRRGNSFDFHRQWIEMVGENTNSTLDFRAPSI